MHTLAFNLDAYIPIGFLLIIVIFTAIVILVFSRLIGPSGDNKAKQIPYESGMNPIGSAHKRFHVRFYVLAMTFLLFDVEIIFLYPWATTFTQINPHSSMGSLFL
ncbi:MAG TPA: NADH-quinone oxidoreductase subunit A, partial [Gammaproteobacteria bacterium]|nr:NADH-quinone oxidoreductase subunit A [Gammaproteobacteria bacterium]